MALDRIMSPFFGIYHRFFDSDSTPVRDENTEQAGEAGRTIEEGDEGQIRDRSAVSRYEIMKNRAKRDLLIKRIAITAILLLNVAALAGCYYACNVYYPLDGKKFLTSGLIVGALAGAAALKFKTGPVNQFNVSQFLTVLNLVGVIFAYTFFLPTKLLLDRIDTTNYADPVTANNIALDVKGAHIDTTNDADSVTEDSIAPDAKGDVTGDSFAQFAENWGSHIDNIGKYLWDLTDDEVRELKSIYNDYKILKRKKADIPYEFEIKNAAKSSNSKKDKRKIKPEEAEENQKNPLVQKRNEYKEGLKEIEMRWTWFKMQVSDKKGTTPLERISEPALDPEVEYTKWYDCVRQDLSTWATTQFASGVKN